MSAAPDLRRALEHVRFDKSFDCLKEQTQESVLAALASHSISAAGWIKTADKRPAAGVPAVDTSPECVESKPENRQDDPLTRHMRLSEEIGGLYDDDASAAPSPEAFERWARQHWHKPPLDRESRTYADEIVQLAWSAWQAALSGEWDASGVGDKS